MTTESAGSFSPPTSTVVDRLRYRAEHQGPQVAYAYLVDGEDDKLEMTYAQLDEAARALAARLQSLNMHGERALLLFSPGMEFITAFYACLYAGVVAVPAYPPRRNRNMVRIQAIADDAQAKIALTTSDVLDRVTPMLDEAPHLKQLHWLATDSEKFVDPEKWRMPDIDEKTLAFLQYTSGSTGTPKGVMLSHSNMMHNSALISYAFEHTRSVRAVFWLPMYHDMGLIGGVLQPMQIGQPTTLMSPMAFLQQPYRWLRAITKSQATVSGGPNFAYELCVNKITPEQREKLDLSSWELAFNGAEPIKPETLDRFTEAFEPCGFRREAFYPCYGMAEATLIISGGLKKSPPVIRTVDGDVLDQGVVVDADPDEAGARPIVGCGNCLPDQEILIVDPDSMTQQPANKVGEIWIAGPSIAKGYWRNEEDTERCFRAYLADTKAGPYLRTGDLGFMQDGELFVTGRLKDLIIVRGVNRYPQDIEATVCTSHELLESSTAAAFSAEIAGKERLVIVAEAPRLRQKEYGAIISAIRKEVALEHEMAVDGIALIRRGSIPKTSSGKIQRHACRNHFLENVLSIVERWVSWDEDHLLDEVRKVRLRRSQLELARADAEGMAVSDPELRDRTSQLVFEKVRAVAKERATNLDLNTDLLALGLDSLERMEIIASIEDAYGVQFPDHILPTLKTCREVSEAVEIYLGGEPRTQTVSDDVPAEMYSFAALPEYRQVKQTSDELEALGMPNPYFQSHDQSTGSTTKIDGADLVNFAGYNYLGLAQHPRVCEAAKQAIDQYGASVSASRLVSGERPIHAELERAIADWVGVDAAVAMLGGHATNETTIGHLVRTGDLVLHDSLAHNSIIQGASLSGARRRPFPHNDWEELDQILLDIRRDYRRVLIVTEGIFGMEGDFPDLPRFIEIKRRHKAWLMIDEAHSIGTMGPTGRGIAEHYKLAPGDVDIWMGTLSKALGSCGGYIAGSADLIEYLKYTAPGFVFSVGMPPASAAAAIEALKIIAEEPQRVTALHRNAEMFLRIARQAGLDTGRSRQSPIVPVILGDSMMTMFVAQRLLLQGINVRPIIYPAVDESAARLRFFINSEHTEAQIRSTINILRQLCEDIRSEDSGFLNNGGANVSA
ncbi:MAG: aminotransferase class I/II-fold pyridoxal phosphate-dependent enzyme [Blastopirellula sp. JB062]